VNFFKLAFQRHQIAGDFTGRGELIRTGPCGHTLAQHLHFVLKAASRVMDLLCQRLAGCLPALALHILKPLDGLAQVIPGRLGQCQPARLASRPQQVLVDFDGGTSGLPSKIRSCDHGGILQGDR
jgi:hypothetical protein